MSDTAGSRFGSFAPGFEFLHNLAGQAAGGMAQGLGMAQLPQLGQWVAPTFNVQDLEKRIEELKAVHFWVDQNAKALAATIQVLEVQKMTLTTLQSMNFSIDDAVHALKANVARQPPPGFAGPAAAQQGPEPAPAAARHPGQAAAAEPSAPPGGLVDPLQWWTALSQQFQQIATHAMQDVASQAAPDGARQVASDLTGQAVKTGTGPVSARASSARQPAAQSKTRPPSPHSVPAQAVAKTRRQSAGAGAAARKAAGTDPTRQAGRKRPRSG